MKRLFSYTIYFQIVITFSVCFLLIVAASLYDNKLLLLGLGWILLVHVIRIFSKHRRVYIDDSQIVYFGLFSNVKHTIDMARLIGIENLSWFGLVLYQVTFKEISGKQSTIWFNRNIFLRDFKEQIKIAQVSH